MRVRFTLVSLTALLPLAFGCGRGHETARQRAQRAREQDQKKPIPVRVAAQAQNQRLRLRLERFLVEQHPPFHPTGLNLPLPEALARLAAAKLDLVLVTGQPSPALRRALERLRPRARVLAGGAEPIALLTQVTNRSGRLDEAALTRILQGHVTRWKDVQGDALPLVAYVAHADIARQLRHRFLHDRPLSPVIRRVADVATALESARRTPGSLAFVPLSRWPTPSRSPKGLKLVALAKDRGDVGAMATDGQAIAQGRYRLWLPVVLFVRRGRDRPAKQLDHVLSGLKHTGLAAALGLPERPGPFPAAWLHGWRLDAR